jgi:hypothetical protein
MKHVMQHYMSNSWFMVGVYFFSSCAWNIRGIIFKLGLWFTSTKITTIKLMRLEYMVQVLGSLSMLHGAFQH